MAGNPSAQFIFVKKIIIIWCWLSNFKRHIAPGCQPFIASRPSHLHTLTATTRKHCCHYGRNAHPNSFYIRICLMTVLHFPQAHTNYKDMRGLIMRAKGSTCEETWFKMLSAGKAISSHQHCHGLSKTQPGLPSSKVQKHFFPPFLSFLFFF